MKIYLLLFLFAISCIFIISSQNGNTFEILNTTEMSNIKGGCENCVYCGPCKYEEGCHPYTDYEVIKVYAAYSCDEGLIPTCLLKVYTGLNCSGTVIQELWTYGTNLCVP